MLTDTAKNELIDLEHAMWREATRYSREFQERHFAPDFVEFGRSGRVYGRDQMIVTGGEPIDARLENVQVRELSPDLALMTYDSVLTRDQDVIEYARRSSIWTKANGIWQMRFHQGTPFSPPPASPAA